MVTFLNASSLPICYSLRESHQVFDGVRPVIPLWRAKLVPAFHDHSQHQQLFAMPEWWRTSKKREHDHTTSPPVEKHGANDEPTVVQSF